MLTSLLEVDFSEQARKRPAKKGTVIEGVCQRLSKIRHHSVALIALFELVDEKRNVSICTSHLYWGEREISVNYQFQLMQYSLLGDLWSSFLSEHSMDANMPKVFCGDCNSNAKGSFYRFVEDQRCPKDDPYLICGLSKLEKEDLTFPFKLQSVYRDNEPRVTCQSAGFSEGVDYIFFETLVPTKRITMKSYEEMIAHGPLPNATYPSDHLMLAAKFSLPDKEKE